MHKKQKNPLKAFLVRLGIDKAARSTGLTLELTVLADSRLEAGIKAEEIADRLLPDPERMYTHAMFVTQINNNHSNAVAQAA